MQRSARASRRLMAHGILVVSLVLLAGAFAPTAFGENSATGGPSVKAIVTFKARPGAAARTAVQNAGGKINRTYTLINGMAISVPANAINGLRHNPLVTSVELDATITTMEPSAQTEATGDLEYDNAWGVTHIGSKTAHDAGFRGQGIKVAVIDTGIDYIHDDPDDDPYVVDPEFNTNYRGGYDFVNHDSDPMDDNGHGTHVAGILAAEHNGYLVVGVAPAVDLYGLKILDANGSGFESDAIAALQWAVDNNMDLVNMSFGTHTNVQAFQDAVANAAAAGLLMVAASGNVDPTNFQELINGCPVAYPGAYPQVLSTTFTNPDDALTGYSCTGPEVDFAAPGDNIFSPVPIGPCMLCSPYGYMALSGTSMASPHLAGSVADLLSAGIADQGQPGLFDDVKARLCATATQGSGVAGLFGGVTPIPPSDPRYPKYFGCGVVNVGAAVAGQNPPTNNPPVANDDSASTSEDTAVDVAVLANDTDPDGDTLSLAGVSASVNGAATANANGTVHFVPTANFSGSGSFDYAVSDGHGGTDSGHATISVGAVNDPPLAVDDSATVAEDSGATAIAVLANDTDVDGPSLSTTSASDPAHGTTAVNANGTVSYAPDPNYHGADSFTYVVSDGAGGSDTGAVSVTVTSVNDPPVAVNDSATTGQGQAVTITVLANDTDVDGQALSIGSVSDPPHGSAVANANGTITYTPDAGYSGPDAFGYTASDGSATSNVATVSITVSATPPPNPFNIGDLDGSTSSSGRFWSAKVTIRVENASHVALSGVVVTGSWSNGTTGSASCTTNTSGLCSVQKAKLTRAGVASVTFTVTGATRSGFTYTAGSNHDPDGDSDGTTIVVVRPV
jgi:subtilisin family serine protease